MCLRTLSLVGEVVGDVGGVAIANIGGGTAGVVVTNVSEDGALHRLVGDKIHTFSKANGRYTIIVELDGHTSLSACAKNRFGAELAPRFVCGGLDVGCIGGSL